MRLAPLYDIASVWSYQRRVPPQKMKLAMRIGRYYRIREIQPRHFEELARTCRYPVETLMGVLRDLCWQLPDESVAVLKGVEEKGMARNVLAKLVDGLTAQCRALARSLGDSALSLTR